MYCFVCLIPLVLVSVRYTLEFLFFHLALALLVSWPRFCAGRRVKKVNEPALVSHRATPDTFPGSQLHT